MSYLVPVGTERVEIVISHSRFIATASHVNTVEEARAYLAQMRHAMPDASHHVYAFRVGYGSSVIEGVSDDGEPSGTAGAPILAVLRGTKIGDVIIVVTRYFGGTKLGTGGLVRAYTEAAQAVFAILPTELKIEKCIVGIEAPYTLYELIKRLVASHSGVIQEESFTSDVMLMIEFPNVMLEGFTSALRELSAGKVTPILL
ncbi:MAG: YigZ family protein [Armatimonadetes bacterium]|nr:YigZ family protein [Anaerolineae bacterium]